MVSETAGSAAVDSEEIGLPYALRPGAAGPHSGARQPWVAGGGGSGPATVDRWRPRAGGGNTHDGGARPAVATARFGVIVKVGSGFPLLQCALPCYVALVLA